MKAHGQIFKNVGSVLPRRSVFDLSYSKLLTCDMGQLIPVMCDEVVPGDHFKIGNEVVIRFQPLVAPILHQVNMYVHYFFVPYRILDEYWEEIITGGVDGNSVRVPPSWIPQDTDLVAGSLWDFLGFPLIGTNATYPQHSRPVVYPKRAYNMIYNEYYRDETLQAKVDINLSNTILLRNWSKDYFTSSLPWQQRGTAPALPITGTVHAIFNHANYSPSSAPTPVAVSFRGDTVNKTMYVQNATGVTNAQNFMDDNSIDLSSASTFDVADLRLAFQVQRWMERNARAGVRYTEFLRSHFGVSPRDERLQRPEYIGGSKAPIIFSEVLQTSQSGTTPQGNMSGHGITASSKFCGSYHATEFGLIMGIMSIMPVPAYNCQGIDRQWIKPTRYDYYFPEFANLSEQAVYNKEICTILDDARNEQIFGYQGRYDEMRVKRNMTVSGMRNTFSYWHLARTFDVGAPPSLNSAFIQCLPRKDIFAVPSQPGLIVSFGNIIKAVRPLPVSPEPGLIDHV